MSESVIKIGTKLHIITRRKFESDIRRHFIGQVTAISGDLQEVRGHAWVFESNINEYKMRTELRTRIFSVAQDGFIVSRVPDAVDLEMLEYRMISRRLVVTDGATWSLDINEFGGAR